MSIFEVKNLSLHYLTRFGKKVHAVSDVSFEMKEGEVLGIAGESGCGKSTLGKAILQLDKATAGTIKYKGKDITNLSKKALRTLRKEIQIILQETT